jgi:hypothetical protein
MNFDNSIESKKPSEAKSCAELLLEFQKRQEGREAKIQQGVKLKFLGIKLSEKIEKITPPILIDGEMVIAADVKDKERDVYNPTPPVLIDERKIMAARVEYRIDENSEVHFFEQDEKDELTWIKIEDAPVLLMQDPFITMVGGEIIVGGVEVSPILLDSQEDSTYRTAFYKGKSLDTLEKFAVGPERMKDIRIIDLERGDGHIGVFGRPQNGIFGPGQITYIELNGLADLTPDNISKAKVIENLFIPTEWGGANQLHLREDGKIGVIGHIACFDEEFNKIYHAISFVFDPETHTALPLKIIATRDNFPKSESKKPDLEKVIFPGGIDGAGNFYAGLGDTGAGRISIDINNLF